MKAGAPEKERFEKGRRKGRMESGQGGGREGRWEGGRKKEKERQK